jgi:hypothetical protein
MTGVGIKKRLRRLELQQEGDGRQIVVVGHCEEEFDAKIAEMEQRGEIGARDLIVCVVNFSQPPERRAGVVYFCDPIQRSADCKETAGNRDTKGNSRHVPKG